MNVTLSRLRRLVIAGACVLLASASIASAQDADPLPGCQVKTFTNLGPKLLDQATNTWSFSVSVHLICDRIEIFADEMTVSDTTVTATGNLLVTQEDTLPSGEQVSVLRLNADHMEMDRQTRLATFYNAYGTARIVNKPGAPDKSMFGTQEPDIMFRADKIERLGPKKYKLTHGAFTTCLQPNPRWQMIGGSGTVVLEDHAAMTNVRFMVKDIPVLYVPYLYYPLTKDDRSSGFLIPSYSSSGIKGNGFSSAYFLVLGRSQDATFYHSIYTKAGQEAAADYRFASAPGDSGDARFHAFYEKEQLAPDGTVERNAHTSYDFSGRISQSLGHGFRLNGNSYYFTDITTQQLYQQNLAAATSQRRNINVGVTGSIKLGPARSVAPLMRIQALYNRNEYFSGTQSSLQGWAPKVNVSLQDNVLKSRTECGGAHPNFLCSVYYTVNAEGAYLQSRPFAPIDAPATQTNVRRFDTLSTISVPLSHLSFLTVSTGAQWRLTEYLDSRDPVTGILGPESLTRNVLDLNATVVGPTVERVFRTPDSHFAQGYKHIIEPRVALDWLSPFDQAGRIFVIDQIDQVPTGTTRVQYSLTNTVMIKPNGPEGNSQNRNFLTVGIDQNYYTNAHAASVDPSNAIAGAGTLSPVHTLVRFTPTARINVQFNIYKNAIQWATPNQVQASAQFSGSASIPMDHDHLIFTAGWTKTNYYTAAQGFVDLPPLQALSTTTVFRLKDWGSTYSFYWDVVNNKFLNQHVTAYYHAQCCGFAVDYQVYSTISSTVPIDHRLAITFTLAGIGSFSPPLGAFGR